MKPGAFQGATTTWPLSRLDDEQRKGCTLAIEKQENGKYRVRVWDARLGRRHHIGTFPTKAAAKSAAIAAENQLRSVGYLETRKDATFGALCDEYLASGYHLCRTTQEWYAHMLKPARVYFGENASTRRITRQEVQGYVRTLAEAGKAPKSIHGHVKTLRQAFEHGIECEYRQDNPAHRLKNLPSNKRAADAIRVLTPGEHRQLVNDEAPRVSRRLAHLEATSIVATS